MTDHTDEEEIIDVITRESAAFFRGDFDEQASFWWQSPQARRIFSGANTGTKTTNGWAEISVGFQTAISQIGKSFDSSKFLDRQNQQVLISGDMAWVYYDQVLIANDPDFVTQELQHELKILHRIAGEWKIACMVLIAPKLDDAKGAIVVLDANGRVTETTDRARKYIDKHNVVRIHGQRLQAHNANCNTILQAAIKDGLAWLPSGLPPSWKNRDMHTISLGRDDYDRPHYCWVEVEEGRLIITFDDGAEILTRLDTAAQTFGLSASQRRLAEQLVEGRDLPQAAVEMGVKPTTLRTQLRRMFEKTGTHNQTTLISALLSVLPPR